jgi:competence protein ComEC
VLGALSGPALLPGATASLLGLASLAFVLALLSRGRIGRSARLLGAFALFAALSHQRLVPGREELLRELDRRDGSAARVRIVLQGFAARDPEGERSITAELVELVGRPVRPPSRGWLRVAGNDPARVDDWLPGDEIELVASIRPREPRNEAERLGPVGFSLVCKSFSLVGSEIPRSGPGGLAGELNALLHGKLRRLVGGHQERESGADLVDALLLGRPAEIDPEARHRYRRTGLAHLLSISGFHVALILMGIDRLGSLLGLRIGARLVVGAGVALFFVPFAGAAPPLIRAAAVAALFAAARLLERPPASLSILAAAALGELALFPEDLFDPGFELSYAAAFGLLVATGPLRRRLAPLPGWLASAIAASLAAELGSAPVVLALFGAIPLYGVLANLISAPLLVLAAGTGSAALALASLLPPIAARLLELASLLTRLGEQPLEVLSRAPCALLRPAPLSAVVLSAGSLAVLAAVGWGGGRRARWMLGIGLAAIVAGAIPLRSQPAPDELRVAAIDVGQGDSFLVRAGGASLLVDGGGGRGEGTLFADRNLAPALARLGAGPIGLVALSHPHPDHCDGLIGLLSNEGAGALLLPRVPDGGECLRNLRNLSRERRIPLFDARVGGRMRVGELEIEILGPPEERGGGPDDRANERSLVLLVRAPGGSVLLPGDIGQTTEEALLRAHPDLAADILKVPHHGSRSSSGDDFLAAIGPRVALVGCGRRNSFGHPAAETVRRYRAHSIPFLSTASWGTFEVAIRAKGAAAFRAPAD